MQRLYINSEGNHRLWYVMKDNKVFIHREDGGPSVEVANGGRFWYDELDKRSSATCIAEYSYIDFDNHRCQMDSDTFWQLRQETEKFKSKIITRYRNVVL